MRIPDGKKMRIIVSEEVADTIPKSMTYGPRVSIVDNDGNLKKMIFVDKDNFNMECSFIENEQSGNIEFVLKDSNNSNIKELFEVADSVMIQIEDFDFKDLELYTGNIKHMIVMVTPQKTHHLMYSNPNDVTRITTGQFPCEMVLTEKNTYLIYNDLISIKDLIAEKCPEKLEKISVMVDL